MLLLPLSRREGRRWRPLVTPHHIAEKGSAAKSTPSGELLFNSLRLRLHLVLLIDLNSHPSLLPPCRTFRRRAPPPPSVVRGTPSHAPTVCLTAPPHSPYARQPKGPCEFPVPTFTRAQTPAASHGEQAMTRQQVRASRQQEFSYERRKSQI